MVHQLHEVYFYVDLCNCFNCIVGGMFSVLASSAVNPALEPRSVQTNDYAIGICCFSAKHTTLRQKSKDWLARNNGPFSTTSRNQIKLFRIYFHIRSRFEVLLFWTKIEKKYGNKILLIDIRFFYEKHQYWYSSLAQVAVKFNYLNIHYLKTFRVGRMMDGRVNLATTG
jgi:hypothetical protein